MWKLFTALAVSTTTVTSAIYASNSKSNTTDVAAAVSQKTMKPAVLKGGYRTLETIISPRFSKNKRNFVFNSTLFRTPCLSRNEKQRSLEEIAQIYYRGARTTRLQR